MASGVQSVNHSDVLQAATAVAFNVDVKFEPSGSVAAAAAAAASVAGSPEQSATHGQSDDEQHPAVTVVSTVVATLTATLSEIGDDGGTQSGRIHQLEQGVDNLMKKMGIHSMMMHMQH